MGLVALFMLIRLGLIDRFFKTSAEKLFMSDVEFARLGPLARKGYFDTKQINHYVKEGLIAVEPRLGQKKIGPTLKTKAIIRKIASTYRQINAKLVLVEDDVVKRGLTEAGVNVISVPDIVYFMARRKNISKEEAIEALERCKLLGWYKAEVMDYIIQEVKSLE